MEDALSHLMNVISGEGLLDDRAPLSLEEYLAQYKEACSILEKIGDAVSPMDFLKHLDESSVTDPSDRQNLLLSAIKVESLLEGLDVVDATFH